MNADGETGVAADIVYDLINCRQVVVDAAHERLGFRRPFLWEGPSPKLLLEQREAVADPVLRARRPPLDGSLVHWLRGEGSLASRRERLVHRARHRTQMLGVGHELIGGVALARGLEV